MSWPANPMFQKYPRSQTSNICFRRACYGKPSHPSHDLTSKKTTSQYLTGKNLYRRHHHRRYRQSSQTSLTNSALLSSLARLVAQEKGNTSIPTQEHPTQISPQLRQLFLDGLVSSIKESKSTSVLTAKSDSTQ